VTVDVAAVAPFRMVIVAVPTDTPVTPNVTPAAARARPVDPTDATSGLLDTA